MFSAGKLHAGTYSHLHSTYKVKSTRPGKIPFFFRGKHTRATQAELFGRKTNRVFFVPKTENIGEKIIYAAPMSENTTPPHEKEHNKNTLNVCTKLKTE